MARRTQTTGTRPRKTDYDDAVKRAAEAIRAHKNGIGTPIRTKKKASVEKLDEIQAKLSRGEMPTDQDIEALELAQVAIAAQSAPKKRGRPRGTSQSVQLAREAALAGLRALERWPLQTYRNTWAPHKWSKCDAVADAMQQCDYRQVATYDPIAKLAQAEAKAQKHPFYRLNREMAELLTRMSALTRTFFEDLEDPLRRAAEATRQLKEATRPLSEASELLNKRMSAFSLRLKTRFYS